MSSGVPVVGARAGGIPSIINDGVTGLLANPNDPKDFAAKVTGKRIKEDGDNIHFLVAAPHVR